MATLLKNLKESTQNLWLRWLDLELTSKAMWITSLMGVILIGFFIFLFFSKYENYVPLFTSERLQKMDVADVVSYLQGADIPYQLKGDNLVLVPPEKRYQIRMELGAYGLPKGHSGKGYELFDSNTWIKGEKELQVLELRALKGQLEQDISQFDNVRSANVIIDMPAPRPFGSVQQKPKASVILKLKPGTRLSAAEIRSITNHVSSAVRGLSPNMVAISDTTGKLYQSIDPEGDFDTLRNAELSAEEHIKAKVDGMLATIIGFNNFYTTVQVVMNREKISQERKIYSGTVEGVNLGNPVVTSITESTLQEGQAHLTPRDWIIGKRAEPKSETIQDDNRIELSKQQAVPINHIKITSTPGKIDSISIGVLIDQAVLNLPAFKNQNPALRGTVPTTLKMDLENQISTILKGYGVKINQSVDFVPFERPDPNAVTVYPEVVKKTNYSIVYWYLFLTSLLLALLGSGLYWLLHRPQTDESEAVSLPTVEKMMDALKEEALFNPDRVRKSIKKWLKDEMKTGAP